MWPLIELFVEPKSPSDRPALDAALAQLRTVCVSVDAESGMAVLHASSEAELGQALKTLIDDLALKLNVGAPQVAYRETITQAASIAYSHKWVGEGRGQFARVVLSFEPGAPNSGFVFADRAPPGAVPEPFAAGAAAGLEAARQLGLLAGYPVIDMAATLVDGAWHDIDSSSTTFNIAARAAFKALRDKGAPVLLEPVMTVRVTAPVDCLDAVVADLHAHRGDVTKVDTGVTGRAPLAGLLGYDRRLEQLTGGQGRWSMAFDRYAPVPEVLPPDGVFPPAIGMRA